MVKKTTFAVLAALFQMVTFAALIEVAAVVLIVWGCGDLWGAAVAKLVAGAFLLLKAFERDLGKRP